MKRFDELWSVVQRLRGEGGCAWDRAQTAESLRPYLLEECHEALAAIDASDAGLQAKELGDLLFTVLMLARIAEERGEFDLDTVLCGITTKMVTRHPHVFDPAFQPQGDEGTVASWEGRKAKERAGGSALDGVPEALPALLRAHRIGEKASRVGFDWPDLSGVRQKLDEEVSELDEAIAAGDDAAIAHELGDVLLTLVNLGRFLPVGAEDSLRMATRRFETRFRRVEAEVAANGHSVHELDLDALEAAWQRAKEA